MFNPNCRPADYLTTVNSLLLLFFVSFCLLSQYLVVQPQQTQAPAVSIREFANMFSLKNGLMKNKESHPINIRALNI